MRRIHELQAAGNVEFVWVDAEGRGDTAGVHKQVRVRTLNLPGLKLKVSPRRVTLRARPFQMESEPTLEGTAGDN